MVDDDKNITKGPEKLKSANSMGQKALRSAKIGSEMSPHRTDYEYESGDDRNDWVHKNVKKLKALYDEGGSKAIDDEWYKFRMADSTKDIHQMSKDEADEAVYDCPYLTQSLYDGWFRNADSSYKPKLTDAIVSSPEMRSAAMSLAYENYRNNIDEPMSFQRFLTTPIKVYRGERGQKHIEDDVFDAYTFDRKMAEHFSGPNGTIIETEIRPIDTFGSMRAVGEAEIWIPRNLSPVKRTDGVDARRVGDWEWKDPVKWAFEDYVESGISESDFSINEDALDSIIRDCEMIELFLSSKSESDKKIAPDVVDRCIDSIQRSVKQMTAFQKAENEDGAFFEGELDSNLGEKEKLYPGGMGFNMDSAFDEWLEEHIEDFESDDEQIKFRDGEWGGFKPKDASAVEEVDSAWDAYKKKKKVDRFRERRQKRLDAKEDEGRWITTENGHKVHLNEEGEPDKGNPHVVNKMSGGSSVDVPKKRLAKGMEVKKTALSGGQIKEAQTKLDDIRKRVLEEEAFQRGVNYKVKDYDPTPFIESEKRQNEARKECEELVSSLPVGALVVRGTSLFEKTGDNEWAFTNKHGTKKFDDKLVAHDVGAAMETYDYPPVRFVESSEEAGMVTDIQPANNETCKEWAKDISSMDRKDLVKKAKKDPEFKNVVDSIVLYTEGGYAEQRAAAEDAVRDGTSDVDAMTIGEYANGNLYEIRDLWKGQDLKKSDANIAEGMVNVIGIINNSEPCNRELYRVTSDRSIFKRGDQSPYVPPKVGEKIKMDAPTSFTASSDIEKDLSTQKYGDKIHYILEPGANAIDISSLSRYKQQEYLSCGEFEVVSVDSKEINGGYVREEKDITPAIRKRGIRENQWGDKYYVCYDTTVVIRQVGKTEMGKHEDSDVVYYDCRGHFDGRMVLPREVIEFRERRKKRLDAKEEPAAWITVNGNHIPVDEEGNPVGGQQKALGEGAEKKTAAESPGKKPSLSKSSINKMLNEIADSDMPDEEKVKAIKNEFPGLRPGTKIIMPESWNSDDGKPQTYTYDGMLWNDDNGWGGMSEEDMAYYFLDKDPNERPRIKSIPRDPDSVEASRKKKEASKNYAMHPDGSINGKYTKDFHNDHVSQEERNTFAKEIKDMVDYEKGWDPDRSLYRGEANRVGDKISAEIKRRAALRRGDKENAPINDQPQVEDIYDVLKDMRDFGPPEGFEPTVNSDLPKERTDAIVKEALDRFPTDWFRDADSKPIINIIDGPGRAICLNKGYINVYTQKDLGLSSGEMITLNDRALVNDLAHELGHYIEWCNQKVQYSARDCLWERGKDSEIVDVEPGYQGYKDSFFNTYMGKIYSHGGTEIISMLMGNIGCFQPFSVLEGHEYDYSKGKYDGRKKKDKESLGYILGVLAGL